jgi:hypothetical protein
MDFAFHMKREGSEQWILVHYSRKTLHKGVTKLASPSELLSHSRVKINRRKEVGMCWYYCAYFKRGTCSDCVWQFMLPFSLSIQMRICSVLADSRVIFISGTRVIPCMLTYHTFIKQFDLSARTRQHQAIRETHKSTFLNESIHKAEFPWVWLPTEGSYNLRWGPNYDKGMTDLTFTMFWFCER